jgi:NADPH-dependent glutamate synthase beta subunit-like oxidoreductase
MDAAISAAQLGAKRTHIIYRRSFKEMPAVPSEVNLAKMQGILFWTTTNPIKIIGDSQGQVKAIELLEVKLGKPDKNGRQEPIPLEDTKFQLAVDIIVEAVGQASDYEIIKALKLDTDSNGIIKVNESGETSRSGIFAAGDIISGGATVVQSLKEGQKVAISIDKYLTET